jgi:hypothetical protein
MNRRHRYMLISRQQWDEFGAGQRDLYNEEWQRLQKGQKLIGESPHIVKLLQLRQVSRAVDEARPTNLDPFPSTEWLSFTSTRQRIVDGQQQAESRPLFPAATLPVAGVGVRGVGTESFDGLGVAGIRECQPGERFSAETADGLVSVEPRGEDEPRFARVPPGSETGSNAGNGHDDLGETLEGEAGRMDLAELIGEDEEDLTWEEQAEELVRTREAHDALTPELLNHDGDEAGSEGGGQGEGARAEPMREEERVFVDEKSSQFIGDAQRYG